MSVTGKMHSYITSTSVPRSVPSQVYQSKPSRASTRDLTIADFPLEEDIQKTGKINQVLKPNQQILVQIAKEPISTKGPRVTSELAFAGRYLVLMPFSDKISVSQKIKSAGGTQPAQKAHHQHQAKELRHHHPHRGRK